MNAIAKKSIVLENVNVRGVLPYAKLNGKPFCYGIIGTTVLVTSGFPGSFARYEIDRSFGPAPSHWFCSCPDHTLRKRAQGLTCKHIDAVAALETIKHDEDRAILAGCPDC